MDCKFLFEESSSAVAEDGLFHLKRTLDIVQKVLLMFQWGPVGWSVQSSVWAGGLVYSLQ